MCGSQAVIDATFLDIDEPFLDNFCKGSASSPVEDIAVLDAEDHLHWPPALSEETDTAMVPPRTHTGRRSPWTFADPKVPTLLLSTRRHHVDGVSFKYSASSLEAGPVK